MSDFRIKSFVVSMVETNCYIVYNESTREAAVVDPGDEAEYLMEQIKELDVKPVGILLTHGHFDHVMAVEELKEEFHVPVYAYEQENALLLDESLNMSKSYMRKSVTIKAEKLLKDGEEFELAGFKWKLIATPGHTSGSACYYLEDEKVLLSGDTIFRESYGRVDFPTSSTEDMIHSIVNVLFELPDDVIVYPGHMGVTTMEYEKRHNPLSIVYKGRR